MLEAGAIQPSCSPFLSNTMVIRKKDGSIRFCMDFRKLNNKTVKDAYAIPRTEKNFQLTSRILHQVRHSKQLLARLCGDPRGERQAEESLLSGNHGTL